MRRFLCGIKYNSEKMQAADSSLQPDCARIAPAVTWPQSFMAPKEFKLTLDQFTRQMGELRLSHAILPAGHDDDEQKRNRHPGEPIITLKRFA